MFSLFDSNGGAGFRTNTAPSLLPTFVANVAAYMNAYGYDGVDLDWEGTLNDGQYEAFISALRKAIGPSKVISMNVYPGDPMTVAANQAANVDQVNVMCYDNDLYANYTWHNSALLNGGDSSKGSVQTEMNQAIAAGIPKTKLGVGTPFYGRHYTGTDAPLQPKGTLVGSFTQYSAIATNSSLLNSSNHKWDATYDADYLSLTGTDEFYTYTGTQSINVRVPWVKAQGFGGIMVYQINYEYIASASGDGRYPLSTALYSAASGSSTGPSYTAPSVTSTSPLAAGTVGTAYSLGIGSSGSTPMTWAVASGTLPSGLSLNSSNGVISGMPATAASSTFTVAASNAAGTSSKQFSLTINPQSTGTSSWFQMVSKNSGMCLDVPGASTAENVQLQQYSCLGGDNQKFQFTPVTGGYEITAKNSGLQLNVRGGTTATQNGAAIIQWPFDGGASNEIWSIVPNVDGTSTFKVLSSGKCMDVTGASPSAGAKVEQWSCNGGNNQKWSLVPVQ